MTIGCSGNPIPDIQKERTGGIADTLLKYIYASILTGYLKISISVSVFIYFRQQNLPYLMALLSSLLTDSSLSKERAYMSDGWISVLVFMAQS